MGSIIISRPKIATTQIRLQNTSSLLTHTFPRGTYRNKKNDTIETLAHLLPDGGSGFPVLGFKYAALMAAELEGRDKNDVRQMFFVHDDAAGLVRLEGKPNLTTRAFRINDKKYDKAYVEYKKWKATLNVEYDADLIDEKDLVRLFRVGGQRVGIGFWRPASSNGSPQSDRSFTHGRWKVLPNGRKRR